MIHIMLELVIADIKLSWINNVERQAVKSLMILQHTKCFRWKSQKMAMNPVDRLSTLRFFYEILNRKECFAQF